MQKVARNTRSCQKVAEQLVESANQAPPSTGVTVIWESPRSGHPHFQNPSDMGIPVSYYLGLQGMPISLGIGEWACPKRRNALHCDTGATICSSTFLGIPAQYQTIIAWIRL